jgi:hypothetical protein
MTRDRLEKLLLEFQTDAYNDEVSQFGHEDVAREILRSFESRICESCKYALPLNLDKDKQFEFKCRQGVSSGLLNKVNKEFGCNRFKNKEDKVLKNKVKV